MKSLFDIWNALKKIIHTESANHHFKIGEIRWVHFGKNIGSEVFGRGKSFLRPGLIIKTPFGNSAIIIPPTSKKRTGSYYSSVLDLDNNQHYALMHQIRYIDGRRIREKLSSVSKKEFCRIQNDFIQFLS